MLVLISLLAFVQRLNIPEYAMNNLYQLIGLKKDSTQRDIMRSFKRYISQKTKILNPSKKRLNSYKAIEFAFGVIGNPESRALYDNLPESAINITNFEVLGYQCDAAIAELKRLLARLPQELARSGGVIFYPIQFPLKDFLTGGERTVSVIRTSKCECPSGQKSCVRCRKNPLIEQIVKHKVAIPPGAMEFHRVYVKGLGDDEHSRGASDVIFIAYTKPDKKFIRDGVDVISTLTVSLADAIKGSVVEFDNFDGEKINIEIEAGAMHGGQKRVKGAGLPYYLDTSIRGDLILNIEIEFPKKLSDEQREALMKELPADESFYV
ncbi:DnaJ domain containing protein [Histomonas meleagridis]|uniref:DnaJ domain containing protein n=1 Tax=Histomonas meleagridis TaxID=135588 RepID=UPI00355AAA4A|nr:DnaJ domain containing protein [Histomonas meleagridis]KAH0802030.1 DnaJ domain containing protein [Histomonas meleagridis]